MSAIQFVFIVFIIKMARLKKDSFIYRQFLKIIQQIETFLPLPLPLTVHYFLTAIRSIFHPQYCPSIKPSLIEWSSTFDNSVKAAPPPNGFQPILYQNWKKLTILHPGSPLCRVNNFSWLNFSGFAIKQNKSVGNSILLCGIYNNTYVCFFV